MDKDKIAAIMNEWMRRYTDEPDKFAGDFETVKEFLAEVAAGQEPTYGAVCAAYMESIARDLDARVAL